MDISIKSVEKETKKVIRALRKHMKEYQIPCNVEESNNLTNYIFEGKASDGHTLKVDVLTHKDTIDQKVQGIVLYGMNIKKKNPNDETVLIVELKFLDVKNSFEMRDGVKSFKNSNDRNLYLRNLDKTISYIEETRVS